MSTCTATISIPHESGERIAATFDCAFTRDELCSYSLQECDPQYIEDFLDTDEAMNSFIDMMLRRSPQLLDDLLQACIEKADSGEAYAGDPYDRT